MKVPLSSLLFMIIFNIINKMLSIPFLGNSLSYLSSPIFKAIINNNKTRNLTVFNNDDDYISFNEIDEDAEEKEAKSFRGRIFTILRDEIEATNLEKSNASIGCQNLFNRYLFGHIDPLNNSNISYLRSAYHIVKLLDDSSKSRNYLGLYDQCMDKKYKFNLTETQNSNETYSTFIVLRFDKTNHYTKEISLVNNTILGLEFNYYLIGFCLPQGYDKDNDDIDAREYCTDDDYLKIIMHVNQEIGDFLHFTNTKTDLFSLRKNPHDSEKTPLITKILSLIPFLLFLLQTIFVIFRILIKYLITYIYIKKKGNNIEINKIEYNIEESFDYEDEGIPNDEKQKNLNIEYNDKKLKIIYQIFNCFRFTENEKELFGFSLTSTKFNNDSGLINLRGIKGLSIFFMIIGFTFLTLFNAPIKVYSVYHIKEILEKVNVINTLVMIGIRYSPRIVISCSGYLLIYKYINFLDRNCINNSVSVFRLFLKFVIYQSHKYILLILLFLFQRFSIYHLFNIFRNEKPIWKYYYLNILQQPSILQFLLSFTMIKYFIPNNEEEKRRNNNLLQYFWLPYNEIIFFIFGVILITIGFKKKYRIDIFILVLIPLLLIIKTIYSYLIAIHYKDTEEIEFPLQNYYPIMYYIFFNYGRFMINPLFNLPYFLLGMYFGLMNYTIHKGIYGLNKSYMSLNFESFEDKFNSIKMDTDNKDDNNELSQEDSDNDNSNEEKQKKTKDNDKEIEFEYCNEVKKMPFLITPILFVQWHRRRNLKHLIILLFIFLGIFIFFLLIFYEYDYVGVDENEEEKKPLNDFINFIYRIDIEFVVLFVQWGAFIIFLKADNFAAILLGHISWTMLTKPYFSFILIINTVLLFMFYQSETMIEINTINIFLYSLIGGTVTFMVTSYFYIFFELPYKRLIHLIFSYRNSNNQDNDENDIKQSIDSDDNSDDGNENLIRKKKD